jgi:hypothetical protein
MSIIPVKPGEPYFVFDRNLIEDECVFSPFFIFTNKTSDGIR